MMKSFTMQEERLRTLLELESHIAAVHFAADADEYASLPGVEPTAPLNYCQMVRAAVAGNAIKACSPKHFRCLAGPANIGIIPKPASALTGEQLRELKTYRNRAICRDVAQNMARCPHWAMGVAVMPLSCCDREPEVLILILNPYRAMRVIQGYSYAYGTQTQFQMTGNAAFCSESTAYPIEHNTMNVSMLCSGTRNRVGWSENDLALSMPYHLLEGVLHGVEKTLNPMELRAHKERIIAALDAKGEDSSWIDPEHNYWSNLKEQQTKQYAGLTDIE